MILSSTFTLAEALGQIEIYYNYAAGLRFLLQTLSIFGI